MQYAAWRVNKYPFSGYVLLGDDIVIAGSAVGQSYKEVITLLGVSISEQKTHVSKDTFEFAKNWYHRGVQITPFPLNGLFEVGTAYVAVAELLRSACRKGLTPARNGCVIDLTDPGFVVSLFETLGARGAFAHKLSYLCRLVLTFPQNISEVSDKVLPFLQLAKYPVSCTAKVATAQEFFLSVAASVKTELVSEEIENLAIQQGNWLRQSLEWTISPPGSTSQSVLPPQAQVHPVFQVIEINLNKLMREGYLYQGATEEGNYEQFLFGTPFRSLPNLDRIDPTRSRRVILNSQARFIKSIKKELEFYSTWNLNKDGRNQ